MGRREGAVVVGMMAAVGWCQGGGHQRPKWRTTALRSRLRVKGASTADVPIVRHRPKRRTTASRSPLRTRCLGGGLSPT